MASEINVGSLEEFGTVLGRFNTRVGAGMRWLFRGQSNADWSLLPSFTRMTKQFGVNREDAEYSEMALTGQFHSRALVHLPPAMLPATNSVTDQWIIMQHFGAPTRLLDWTQSPYVAAYFAVDLSADTDAAVWALSSTLLVKEAKWPMIPTDPAG